MESLTQRQKAFIETVATNPGCSLKQIAEKTGLSYGWILQLTNKPEIKEALNEINISVKERIISYQTQALEKLIYLLENSDNENIQLRASMFLLSPVLTSFTEEIPEKQTVKIEFVDEKPEYIPEDEKNDLEQSLQ